MWPKRKGKNRRHNREATLEVKRRSREVRTARIRMLAGLVGAIGGSAIGVLLLWQAYQWALMEFVYRNEAFAIRRIELRHQGRLRGEQIRNWAGVAPGQNLLALDLDRVRQDLELNPWIAWADVQAQRPDCLRLTVTEREPVAQVVVWRFSLPEERAWSETNYLDATGCVLPPLRPEWLKPGEVVDFSHLPRLVGLDEHAILPGQPVRLRSVDAALRLIRAYENSSLFSLVDLERVEVSDKDLLIGTLRQGTRVVFGMQDFERQMRRWRSVYDYAQVQGRTLDWLDLSVTNNLPARWRDSTNNNAPAPVQPKPKRNSRRHV